MSKLKENFGAVRTDRQPSKTGTSETASLTSSESSSSESHKINFSMDQTIDYFKSHNNKTELTIKDVDDFKKYLTSDERPTNFGHDPLEKLKDELSSDVVQFELDFERKSTKQQKISNNNPHWAELLMRL